MRPVFSQEHSQETCDPGKHRGLPQAEGGKPRRILPDDPENETNPSWSPDGRKIVFDGFPHGTVHILDLDTHKVTTLPDSTDFWLPNWSPDGRYISAISTDLKMLKIFDLNTGKWRVLETGDIHSPAWSRDSQFIYFLSSETGGYLRRIRVIDGKQELVADLRQFNHVDTLRMRLDRTDAPLLTRDKSTANIYALSVEEK